MKIDAHQHYWNPARGDYHWMPEDHPILSRTYGPVDLAAHLKSAGIEKTILVQAAQSLTETEYLLGIADATPSVAAVVGWIDFENRDDLKQLERLKRHPKFAGVRPMIQDIADDNWMLRDDIQWAFSALVDLDLTFDALGFPRHLKNFLQIFQRYPDLRAVVDHCMKPQIAGEGKKDPGFAQWAVGISLIGRETSAFCKLSGLVTEVSGDWSVAKLTPYVEHVLAVFGPDRVMWGSDWPVCLLKAEYGDWHQAADQLTQALTVSDINKLFGGVAASFLPGLRTEQQTPVNTDQCEAMPFRKQRSSFVCGALLAIHFRETRGLNGWPHAGSGRRASGMFPSWRSKMKMALQHCCKAGVFVVQTPHRKPVAYCVPSCAEFKA